MAGRAFRKRARRTAPRVRERRATNQATIHPRWYAAVGVLTILAVTGIGILTWMPRHTGSGQSSSGGGQPVPEPTGFDADGAIRTLVTAGWDETSARRVIGLNAPFLSCVAEASDAECEAKVKRLARLGDPRHAYARRRLENLPELAGLMANTLDADGDGPNLIATAVGGDANSQAVMALFVTSATGSEAISLARLIARDRDLSVRIVDQQAMSLLSWLEPTDDVEPKAADAYRAWARRIVSDALDSNREESLDEAYTLLSLHSARVSSLLRKDLAFRESLADRTYPVFRRVVLSVEDDGFSRDCYFLCPQIWEFIHRYPNEAERLLKAVGPVAIDVLMDSRFAEQEESLLALLACADARVIDGLLDERVRGAARFPAFLARPLPPKTRAAALQKLAEEPQSASRMLADWESMSDQGVIDEVGEPATGPVTWLPGYSAAVLVTKMAQGRRLTGLDVTFAALDALEAVLMVRGGGATLKAIATSARKVAARKIGVEAAENIAKNESRAFIPWAMRALQKSGRQMLRAVREKLVVDMTPVVRQLYKRSGLNAKTFRYVDGLDARIFMRQDRRVVVDLIGDHPLGRFMAETAMNAGIEAVGDTKVATTAARAAVVEGGAAVEAARRNISAWWLAVGDGGVDRLVGATAAP